MWRQLAPSAAEIYKVVYNWRLFVCMGFNGGSGRRNTLMNQLNYASYSFIW
jgi:hypothetical protein